MTQEKKRVVFAWIFGWIAAVIYITGLAFLVPFISLTDAIVVAC